VSIPNFNLATHSKDVLGSSYIVYLFIPAMGHGYTGGPKVS
jgi:hypothetical protein